MKTAILDDDPRDREHVVSMLQQIGHTCFPFASGRALQQSFWRQSYDLLILGWHSDDLPGTEVLAWVRRHIGFGVPVVMTSTYPSESDVVYAMSLGADTYITKRYNERVFPVRIKALLRRTYPEMRDCLDFGRYQFEERTASVSFDQQEVELTPREFDLALLLFRNLGRTIARNQIHEAVCRRVVSPSARSLDTHVSRVRRKLQLVPENGFRLHPVYGLGYRLEEFNTNGSFLLQA